VTDLRWLQVEYSDSASQDVVARATWIARTLASGTNWPAVPMQQRRPSPQEADQGTLAVWKPQNRTLGFGEFEIVSYSVSVPIAITIGPVKAPTRGASLLVRFRQPLLAIKLDGFIPVHYGDSLNLAGDDDQSAAALVAAVKQRFGEGPGVSKNWKDRAFKSPELPSMQSDEKAAPATLPTRTKATRSSLSPTSKQNVTSAEEPKKTKPAAPRQPVTAVEASKPAATSPSAVFISYSHKDSKWLEKLQIHLRPLERQGHIDFWDDTRMRPGDEWRKEIEHAITSCKIAILLVSPHFMASDFINHNELPPLLERAKQRGVRIISIIISPSSYEYSELAQYQSVNPPSESLQSLMRWEQDEYRVDAYLVKVYGEVKRALGI